MRSFQPEFDGRGGRLGSGSPETQLWCAVITRALEDALDNAATIPDGRRRNQICEDARNWFIRNGKDFQAACNAAGCDADAVRARVLVMLEARPLAPHVRARRDSSALEAVEG